MMFAERLPAQIKVILIVCLAVGMSFGVFWFAGGVYRWIAVRYAPMVIPIDRTKILFPLADTVKHYYTYKPHETLMYEIPWFSETVTNRTNNDGLVDRFNYPVPKNPGVFRIIALGDSFTQGVMVETRQSYPEVLEDLFHRNEYETPVIEVLNFGVGGYDVEYAMHRFRTQGMKYDPDMVLWLVQFNDFYLINEKMGGVRPSFRDELAARYGLTYSALSQDVYEKSLRLSEIYYRMSETRSVLDYQARKFWEIRTFFRGPIGLVYFEDDDPMIVELLQSFRQMDPSIFLVELPPEVPRFPDGHPDADGHAAIAEHTYNGVIPRLAERGIRPLQKGAYE